MLPPLVPQNCDTAVAVSKLAERMDAQTGVKTWSTSPTEIARPYYYYGPLTLQAAFSCRGDSACSPETYTLTLHWKTVWGYPNGGVTESPRQWNLRIHIDRKLVFDGLTTRSYELDPDGLRADWQESVPLPASIVSMVADTFASGSEAMIDGNILSCEAKQSLRDLLRASVKPTAE